jgi:hypothetical protein
MRKILFVLGLVAITIGVFILIVWLFNRDSSKGALQVTSNPRSKVYLDGKLIGVTPLCKCDAKQTISVGQHTIELIPETGNLLSFEDRITISPSVLTVVDRTFGEGAFSSGSIISLSPISDKNDAQLSVVTFPDKTNITLDNSESPSGMSPLLLKKLTESDHELKISKDGYVDKVLRIRALSGYRLEAIVTLAVLPDTSSGSAILPMSPTSTPIPVIQTPKITILTTPTGFLRVREDASIVSVEIGRVNPGEKYELVDEVTGWYRIKLTDGKMGWVSSQYASKQ